MISWEYLAGFVDGEAYIGLVKTKWGSGRRPKISICNTDYSVMREIGTFLSCNVYDKKLQSLATKGQAEITIWGDKVIPILENLMPYLIVKKHVAFEVLEYAKSNRTSNIEVSSLEDSEKS